jgi:hypothetical protein
MSVMQRIADSSRTSRHIRKMPIAEDTGLLRQHGFSTPLPVWNEARKIPAIRAMPVARSQSTPRR